MELAASHGDARPCRPASRYCTPSRRRPWRREGGVLFPSPSLFNLHPWLPRLELRAAERRDYGVAGRTRRGEAPSSLAPAHHPPRGGGGGGRLSPPPPLSRREAVGRCGARATLAGSAASVLRWAWRTGLSSATLADGIESPTAAKIFSIPYSRTGYRSPVRRALPVTGGGPPRFLGANREAASESRLFPGAREGRAPRGTPVGCRPPGALASPDHPGCLGIQIS